MKLSQDHIFFVYPKTSSDKLSNLRPTFIGTVAGIRFFEHPSFGDEAALIVKQDGRWVDTHFWEIPDIEELGFTGVLV